MYKMYISVVVGFSWSVPSQQKDESNITKLDIPGTATKVIITETVISEIPTGAFNHLHMCTYLNLERN